MLFIVATPIGKVEDLSSHARTVLGSVDFILCEDTRNKVVYSQTVNLHCSLFRVCSYEQKRVQRALEEIRAGKTAALVSDAGTPQYPIPGQSLSQKHTDWVFRLLQWPVSSGISGNIVSGFFSLHYIILVFLSKKGVKGETDRRYPS